MNKAIASWDHLCVFLSAARHRNLASVARRLGIDHSTAFRRLRKLEHQLGGPLFERRPDGLALTTLGTELLPSVENIETAMLALERHVVAQDVEPSGTVRLSVSDSLAIAYFPERIPAFQERFPHVRLDFSVDNQVADLTRREADVAVRPARHIEGDLVGRKAARMAYGGYAAKSYIDRNGRPASISDLSSHKICGYGDSLNFFSAAQWLARHVDPNAITMQFDNTSAMTAAAGCGLGIAVLPCFLGDTHPNLERVIEPSDDLTTDVWVLTHPDLRRSTRIRAVLDFLFKTLAADRKLLEGLQPAPQTSP
jgi:DNA-binding transcriptional LysR family regulator